jgi:putative ubiquitin-RnfH superfamily antitoxin RatB of RatAB toxin-antitoxin module
MNRDEFMIFFRDLKCLNELSADDRIEIFSTVLLGSMDISKKLLEKLLKDYDASD